MKSTSKLVVSSSYNMGRCLGVGEHWSSLSSLRRLEGVFRPLDPGVVASPACDFRGLLDADFVGEPPILAKRVMSVFGTAEKAEKQVSSIPTYELFSSPPYCRIEGSMFVSLRVRVLCAPYSFSFSAFSVNGRDPWPCNALFAGDCDVGDDWKTDGDPFLEGGKVTSAINGELAGLAGLSKGRFSSPALTECLLGVEGSRRHSEPGAAFRLVWEGESGDNGLNIVRYSYYQLMKYTS